MAYSAMSQLYMSSVQPRQGIEWGEKALRLADELNDVRVKTHALNNIGCSLVELGEEESGIATLEQSLALAQEHHLIGDTIRAYHNLGMHLAGLGHIQRAAVLMREGIAFAGRVGWEAGPITLLVKAGWVEMMLGDWARAQRLLDRALSVTAVSNRTAYLYASMHVGMLHLRRGQLKEAQRLLEAALPEYERIDHPDIHGAIWAILAEAAFRLGDLDRAVACMDRCLQIWHDLGAPLEGASFVATGLEIYAHVGQGDKMEEVLAFVSAKGRNDGSPMVMATAADNQAFAALCQERYGDAAPTFAQAITVWQQLGLPFEEAWSRRNRAVSLLRLNDGSLRDEARQELAAARQIFQRLGAALELERIDAVMKQSGLLPRPMRSTSPLAHGLTRREREVIALIARGYSNRAIAEALVISEKTAEIHVSNILGKLGVASRTQAAAYAIEHRIVAEVEA
jgi:ATP/maltotriose-dependent transcriptional regulator MalT